MKLKTYTYEGDPMHAFMDTLSTNLKAPLKKNTINIPENLGSGFIKNSVAEKDFCIRLYHVRLKADTLYQFFYEEKRDEPLFKLTFSLDSSTFPLSLGMPTSKSILENSAVLYSTDFSRTFMLPRDKWINRLVLIFTKDWLEENFAEASSTIGDMVDLLVKKNKPTMISEMMGAEHYMQVNELANEISLDNCPLIHIKAKSLTLTNNFLNKIVYRDANDIAANHTLYYSQVINVEKRLADYYDKQMPCIPELANEFNMSQATLQRHFKQVYGKTIYNYYLEKKLALGKKLIRNNHKSVSEVAYSLGYNKINSFSKAFKKCYGILPSELYGKKL